MELRNNFLQQSIENVGIRNVRKGFFALYKIFLNILKRIFNKFRSKKNLPDITLCDLFFSSVTDYDKIENREFVTDSNAVTILCLFLRGSRQKTEETLLTIKKHVGGKNSIPP